MMIFLLTYYTSKYGLNQELKTEITEELKDEIELMI